MALARLTRLFMVSGRSRKCGGFLLVGEAPAEEETDGFGHVRRQASDVGEAKAAARLVQQDPPPPETKSEGASSA